MSPIFRSRRTAFALLAAATLSSGAAAQQFDATLFREMQWRDIGPIRGGRTKAATGVRQQPNVFYIAATNGGVWKSTDYGRIWTPIFDDQPTQSVGAVAVAPSDPNVIYAGSGEGLQRPDLSTGNGIYKSTDAGKTWIHLGLRDGQQIPQIIVDPANASRLFVAVLGHPYGANAERGLYRSTDGGQTFRKVLYKDENTGAIDVAFAPNDPNTLYAALWESRQGPWENGAWQGEGSALMKSTDGGETWKPIMNGLPTFADGVGRIGIGVSPSDRNRVYVTVDAGQKSGIYRSDDAGETWRKVSSDPRVTNRGSDFAEVKVDPKNADVVWSLSIVVWKSMDGGSTWTMVRGAPGGDDYHRIWINPDRPEILLVASDQGAVVSVNGGETWSSWYNQSTAQMYHVATDNAWPYRVCSGQQESGSACVQSRGNDGQITFREWRPVGTEEYGYVAPDPLDPNVVYGGKVSKFDYRTGQTQDVSPKPFRDANYRALRTAPLLFSPVNPRKLYLGMNTVWETVSGGQSWRQISPDLTRTDSVVPPNVGKYASTSTARARHPGVVYTIAPSYVKENIIWAGSDDGLIHVTFNGGTTWKNVTPPQLVPWAKVSIMDASHFDTLGAYAAINTIRIDDFRPHIYRTHDGGKSWKEIVSGIDSGAIVNVVREDPKRRGLLFAGSETQVWVSFDDGEHWQSLRNNLPATSIRDLVIKDDDVVVGTHGRGFWILDDITPLRQIAPPMLAEPARLFKPGTATRVRFSLYTDTPIPPDEPRSKNPPDGVVLTYNLASAAGSLTLEVLDAAGKLVRRYEKGVNPEPDPRAEGNWPDYWIRPWPYLNPDPGMHRFVWDVRYPRPKGASFSFPISAIPARTTPEPLGPLVAPGSYSVRLTADGKTYTQPLVVRMDPRVKTPPAELQATQTLIMRLYDAINRSADAIAAAREIRSQLTDRASKAPQLAAAIESATQKLSTIDGGASGGRGGRGGGGGGAENLTRTHGEMVQLYDELEAADKGPTAQIAAAASARMSKVAALVTDLSEFRTRDLAALNAKLEAIGVPPIR